MPGNITFQSLLFADPADLDRLDVAEEPDYFADLALTHVVDRLCAHRSSFRLEQYAWTTLAGPEDIRFRQQTFRDAQQPAVRAVLTAFSTAMDLVRQHLSLKGQVRYLRQRQRCLLDAAVAYCSAVRELAGGLEAADPDSPALTALARHLTGYVASSGFTSLERDAGTAEEAITAVRYDLHISGLRIRVRQASPGRPDLGVQVSDLFARFRDHGVPGEPGDWRPDQGFGHIAAAVLDHVADLHPHAFGLLANFEECHAGFFDDLVRRVNREVEFVLAWLEIIDELKEQGLDLALPEVVEERGLDLTACFDLALATNGHARRVVTNDLRLDGPEQFLVVTGPNQGGKTTTARTFGQVHHLAAIGCPVPAAAARVGLADRIFVQFERQEDPGSQRGKLQDDLVRMHAICAEATARSVVILNEVFSSTATEDALRLARSVLGALLECGCSGVCVTFLDELAEEGPGVVSMVAEVDRDDRSKRTFKVNRRPADGKAYAAAIAAKYRLGREEIKERIER